MKRLSPNFPDYNSEIPKNGKHCDSTPQNKKPVTIAHVEISFCRVEEYTYVKQQNSIEDYFIPIEKRYIFSNEGLYWNRSFQLHPFLTCSDPCVMFDLLVHLADAGTITINLISFQLHNIIITTSTPAKSCLNCLVRHIPSKIKHPL